MIHKKILKQTAGITMAGVGLGLGSQIAAQAGSPSTGAALGKMSGALPLVATIGATKILMGQLKKLPKK